MTRSTCKRKFHYKSIRHKDPNVKPFGEWLSVNRAFYDGFRHWMQDAGYSQSTLGIYRAAFRIALGWLDKPYWEIDPQADLDRVRDYITTHYNQPSTRECYLKGIAKLEEYLRYRCQRPKPEKRVNWGYYLDPLPGWLAADVRLFITHQSRSWLPEVQHRATCDFLSHATLFLRWAAANASLTGIGDLTPNLWFDYVDARLADGIKPVTLNSELSALHGFLFFLAEQDRPVCQRTLRVKPLKESTRLPRDVPLDQLRILRHEIEKDAAANHAGIRRMGVMDRAWFLLMLHSGLRTGEIRRMRLSDLDTSTLLSAGLEGRRVRIEQSKGLKDRIVCLSKATVDALRAYLDMRGRMPTDHVFTYRHQPLSESYCGQRLRTYGKRCGLHVTPHQLRHTCATLLLNAGAPILTVQTILGHKHIDTTLAYARLYDGTVAADYYRAMDQIETRMELQEGMNDTPPTGGQLLALVDALHDGTLNESQREMVQALRAGILALVEQADAHCGE
jgi:site-specific recombinase XerD